VERLDPQSYVLDLELNVRVPTPNRTLEELAQVTPELPKLLPRLGATFTPDSVSPLFQELYDFKVGTLREDLVRLDQLLSRHNFYDCQTILRLRDPETKRSAILLQADMDVDADGSDTDRLPEIDGRSANFKPFTSYRWKKKTSRPSSFLAAAEEKLRRYETEFAQKGLTMERNRDLRIGIQRMKAEVDSLKRFSFLIAATDPYIVLPGIFTRAKDAGRVGDYAVIVFGDKIYPALVGDVGPSDKVGEASLRIAKEINALATPYNRPVSDLKVTYLIFPETADTPFGPPDLEKLQARCEKLVQEIGGASVALHHWENIIPTPTPTPSPTLTPSATPSPTPLVAPTFAFPTPAELPSLSPESSLSATSSPSLTPTTPRQSRHPRRACSPGRCARADTASGAWTGPELPASRPRTPHTDRLRSHTSSEKLPKSLAILRGVHIRADSEIVSCAHRFGQSRDGYRIGARKFTPGFTV
jgi:hypothetical protein